MATLRVLPHTVTLYNSLGEIDYKKSYQITVLEKVYFGYNEGVKSGKTSEDAFTLYYFDNRSAAYNVIDGRRISAKFLPYHEWYKSLLTAPTYQRGFFTFSKTGDDYVVRDKVFVDDVKDFARYTDKFTITHVERYKAGTPRMWHYKCTGE